MAGGDPPAAAADRWARSGPGESRSAAGAAGSAEQAVAHLVDQPLRLLHHQPPGVVHAGGPVLFGAGLPLGAGGVGNAVAAGAGALLGGGAPQLKVPGGGELLAVLSALLLFRARSWRVSTDESRAKLSSSYTDIPVSPA